MKLCKPPECVSQEEIWQLWTNVQCYKWANSSVCEPESQMVKRGPRRGQQRTASRCAKQGRRSLGWDVKPRSLVPILTVHFVFFLSPVLLRTFKVFFLLFGMERLGLLRHPEYVIVHTTITLFWFRAPSDFGLLCPYSVTACCSTD